MDQTKPNPDAFVGVDNGNSGAVAALDGAGKPVMLFDTPLRHRHPDALDAKHARGTKAEELRKKRASKKETDPDGVIAIVSKVKESFSRPIFVLEKYQLVVPTKDRPNKPTSPQAPIYAAWAYGVWVGILHAFDCEYIEVTPMKWQNRLIPGARGEKNKSRAVETAERMWPEAAKHFRGPRGGLIDGRADAMLIASYGRDVHKHEMLFRRE